MKGVSFLFFSSAFSFCGFYLSLESIAIQSDFSYFGISLDFVVVSFMSSFKHLLC